MQEQAPGFQPWLAAKVRLRTLEPLVDVPCQADVVATGIALASQDVDEAFANAAHGAEHSQSTYQLTAVSSPAVVMVPNAVDPATVFGVRNCATFATLNISTLTSATWAPVNGSRRTIARSRVR